MCIHVLLHGDHERDRAKYREMELACTARKCQSICSLHEQFCLQGRTNAAQGCIRGHCDGLHVVKIKNVFYPQFVTRMMRTMLAQVCTKM